jgi:NAD(P)H-hydrate repair Nnr-like enzyme with NAD(P)H-hydrate dehydratase domain
LPLPSDKFSTGSAKRLLKILPKNPHIAVIGMVMTVERQQALVYLINELKSMGTKLLLDASSLVPGILTGASTIISPHPGEFKRLFQRVVLLILRLQLKTNSQMFTNFQESMVSQ